MRILKKLNMTIFLIDHFQPTRAANSDFTRCLIPRVRQNNRLPPPSARKSRLRISSVRGVITYPKGLSDIRNTSSKNCFGFQKDFFGYQSLPCNMFVCRNAKRFGFLKSTSRILNFGYRFGIRKDFRIWYDASPNLWNSHEKLSI